MNYQEIRPGLLVEHDDPEVIPAFEVFVAGTNSLGALLNSETEQEAMQAGYATLSFFAGSILLLSIQNDELEEGETIESFHGDIVKTSGNVEGVLKKAESGDWTDAKELLSAFAGAFYDVALEIHPSRHIFYLTLGWNADLLSDETAKVKEAEHRKWFERRFFEKVGLIPDRSELWMPNLQDLSKMLNPVSFDQSLNL